MIHSIATPLRLHAAATVLFAALLGGCVSAPPPEPAALPAKFTRAAWNDLPGFAQDRVSEAWPALLAGCRALVASAARAIVWRAPCEAAQRVDASDEAAVRTFLASNFSPYRVAFPDGRDHGLVTGYYEPKLEGSRERTPRYSVPLFAKPDDLLAVDLADLYPELRGRRVRARLEGSKVVPYWSRRDIDNGSASLPARVLAWVADPLDAFFLQVQGSGRIAFADGGLMRLGYADQNGHPYRSIARVLVERGEMTLEESSMQAIRAWAERHPDGLAALLDENPSYVFFRELPAPAPGTPEAAIDGPLGSLGVPLLARRTIAVDARAIPLGAPVWLATSLPQSDQPLQRLVLAQDTGGAIRGAVRADFFFGFGDEAAEAAGRMRQQGRLWLLWPAGAPLPVAATP